MSELRPAQLDPINEQLAAAGGSGHFGGQSNEDVKVETNIQPRGAVAKRKQSQAYEEPLHEPSMVSRSGAYPKRDAEYGQEDPEFGMGENE